MTVRLSSTGVETVIQKLAQDMAQQLPVTVASVTLWDHPTDSLKVGGISTTRSLPWVATVGARVPLDTAPWHRTVLAQQAPMLIDAGAKDVSVSSDETTRCLSPNLRWVYLAPIRVSQQMVGVLGLGEMRSREREPFSEDKRERCHRILEGFLESSVHAWEEARLLRQVGAMSSLFRAIGQMAEARSYQDVLECLASEVSDWLGTSVKGILLDLQPAIGVEVLARRQLDDSIGSVEGMQLITALARVSGRREWPISVIPVSEDPLDPLHVDYDDGSCWTRISLPLMEQDRLLAVACLYVEGNLRLTELELDAFRHRAEVAATGIRLVRAHLERASERHWHHRLARELLTTYQTAVVREAVSAFGSFVSSGLRSRAVVPGDSPDQPSSECLSGTATLAVDDLLTRARDAMTGSSPVSTSPVDVHDLVRVAIEIVGSWNASEDGRESAPVDLDSSAKDIVANVSLALIGVLAHVIQTAVESIDSGGRVQVRIGCEADQIAIAIGHTGTNGADQVRRESDGALLPSAVRSAQGLHLSVARTLAASHGGDVSVGVGESGGRTFVLRLPAAASRTLRAE